MSHALHRATHYLALAACCSLLTTVASAAAQAGNADNERPPAFEPAERMQEAADTPTYQLSIEPSFGTGLGSSGIGGRVGLSGEYWLSKVVGVGLEGALLGQSALIGDSSSAGTIALVGALRSAPRHAYLVFTVAVGYARAQHTDSSGLCLDFSGSGCPADRVYHYDGVAVGSSLGWLAHPGDSWFEIGPVARIDVITNPSGHAPTDYLFTLNLALGYASLR